MDWMSVFYLIISIFFVWIGVRLFRQRPDLFSKENMGKSVYTMGLLALGLVVVVLLCIMLLSP